MGAKRGNKNALKEKTRIDVHVSIADTKEAQRRSKMERYMHSLGETDFTEDDIKHKCQQWLYDWIDGLKV